MIPVTVVIPTHNRKDLVVRAAGSLAAQDYPRELLQIIVATDRCSDGTADALAARFPDSVTVLDSPRGGASAAINMGMAAATGEILITMDDEMQASPQFVAAHVRAHAEAGNGATVVTGYSPVELSPEAKPLERFVARNYERFHERLAIPDRRSSPLDFNTGNFSIRTRDIRASNGFDESYFFQRNDFELGSRLIEKGFHVTYCPEARAPQTVAVDSDTMVNRAEPRAMNDVRLAREHPWCIEHLPFRDRLRDGDARSRWHSIWRGRHLLVPLAKAARRASPDSVALVNREYGVRYATAAIRAAGGWDEWMELSLLDRAR